MENNSDPNQNPPPSYSDGMNFHYGQAVNSSFYNNPYLRYWNTLENQDESAQIQLSPSIVNLDYTPSASSSLLPIPTNYISHQRNDEVSQMTSELSEINIHSNSRPSSPEPSTSLIYTTSPRPTRSHSESRSRRHHSEAPYSLRSRSITRIPDYVTDTTNRSNQSLHLQSGGMMTSNYPNYNTVRNLYNTGQAAGSEGMFGQNTSTVRYSPFNPNINLHPKKRFQITETPPNFCQSRAMDLTRNQYVLSNEANQTSSHQTSSSHQNHETALNIHQPFLNNAENETALRLMSLQRPSGPNSTSFVQDSLPRVPQWLNEHCIRNYSQQPPNQEMHVPLQYESQDCRYRNNLNPISLRQMTTVQRPSPYTMVTPPPYMYPPYPVATITPGFPQVCNNINYNYNNYIQNRYDCRRPSPVQRIANTSSAASAPKVTTGKKL